MKKKLLAGLLALGMTLTLFGCGKEVVEKTVASPEPVVEVEDSSEEPNADQLTGLHYVLLEIQDYGSIVLELDADAAPITVTNFMKLVISPIVLLT